MRNYTLAVSVLAMATGLSAGGAMAAGKLNLYCSAQEDWCQLVARSFEETSGIDVDMTRNYRVKPSRKSRPRK